jgi:hypothetical protein
MRGFRIGGVGDAPTPRTGYGPCPSVINRLRTEGRCGVGMVGLRAIRQVDTDLRYQRLRDLMESDPEWHDGEVVVSY